MELPQRLHELTNQEDKRILGEFYDTYKDRQWFRRAELIENHPNHLRRTLELYVNYRPTLENKEIIAFTHKYNLALQLVDLSHRD